MSTLGFLSAITLLTTFGMIGFGQRWVTWKTRALEREAQLVHMRLGRFRVRRKHRAHLPKTVS